MMKSSTLARVARTVVFAVVAAAIALGLASPANAAFGTVPSSTMYGDPVAAARWWRHQKYDDCVLMASADVIGQMTGREPSERAIIEMAESTPSDTHPGSIYIKPADTKNPNSGQGTIYADIPTLLAQYGVGAVVSDKDYAPQTGVPAGIDGIEQLLGSGHAVIVSVNAEMVWGQPIETTDDNGDPVSDHAVVVTGVDTANNVVHLNDSGIREGRDEQVPMELFRQAWETGNELVVVTTETVGY